MLFICVRRRKARQSCLEGLLHDLRIGCRRLVCAGVLTVLGSSLALESVMRPIGNSYSDLIRPRTFYRPLAMLVALAIGGIGGATVILSLASPPITERSSHAIGLETSTASPRPELQPTLASAMPEAPLTANTVRSTAAVVQPMRKLGVPTKRTAQNHAGRMASRGNRHYRNFARYFGSRFSASW